MLSNLHLSRLNFLRYQFSLYLKKSSMSTNNRSRKKVQCYKEQNKPFSQCCKKPKHFINLRDANEEVIKSILCIAMTLKRQFRDTHEAKTYALHTTKVMLLEDHRQPLERMALSKAVSLLGADEVHITSEIDWDHDYYSKIFSEMADIIFVSADMFGCLKNFAKYSLVPVMVMRSRLHSPIQSLATIMSMLEDYGDITGMNVAYVGWPHQSINDYLFLCPLSRANFFFKCCCPTCPVSPFMLHDSESTFEKTETTVKQYTDTLKAISQANVIISGPTSKNKDKIPEFTLKLQDIKQKAQNEFTWTYYHTLPRGPEIADELFWHENSRTFNAFKNMQYICAALILHGLR